MSLLLVYYVSLAVLLLAALQKIRNRRTALQAPLAQLPPLCVTENILVQIPVYNEVGVIERLLQSLAQTRYPKEKLHIQVLDDSTDQSSTVIARALGDLSALGFKTSHLRREHRRGYKAGALNDGLRLSQAPFVAIFDADFEVPPDFFHQTLAGFTQAHVAFVQAAWDFSNASANFLTRIQARLLRAHFSLEKRAQAARNGFLGFNGTAGLWRRDVLEDLGGWQEDCLTEDLALSVRAAIKGYRCVYVPHVACPSELPERLIDLKHQYMRWAKGSAQVLRTVSAPLLFQSRLSLPMKVDIFLHLSRHGIFLALLLWLLASPWVWLDRPRFSPWHLFDSLLLLSVTLLSYLYFSPTSRLRTPQRWRVFGEFAGLSLLSLALIPSQCVATVSGLLFSGGVFERTPKRGSLAQHLREPPRREPGLSLELTLMTYVWAAVIFIFWEEFWVSKPLLILQAITLSIFPLLGVSTLQKHSKAHAPKYHPNHPG